MKKTISILLSALLIMLTVTPAFAEGVRYDDYVITNPYADIDWSTVNAYKTQLHCQTTASDGFLTIKEAAQMYYDLDYDIVAFTDHGTNNPGWDKVPQTIPLMREMRKNRTGGAKNPIIPLTAEEYDAFLTGTAETSHGEVRTHDSGMVDVLMGNELNMATPIADCHLTHYWCDYGQGLAGVYGDYETPSRESAKQGGVVMLAHVGEYVYNNHNTTSRFHVGQKVDDYYVNKFARIFLDNPVGGTEYSGSVCGMGINSSHDEHTRCDRILYDQILQKTIPFGVVPWGFTFSDSHNVDSMNNAYCMFLMDDYSELNNDARNLKVRECMEKGEFFSVSHYSNGFELDGQREYDGVELDTEIDSDLLLTMNDTPMVTYMNVDETTDNITVEAENADRIVWVSAGNVIKRETAVPGEDGKVTFTLSLHEDGLMNDPSYFVRFYVTGPQGICYSQPMVIKAVGADGNVIEYEQVAVPETHDISTFLRKFVTIIDWIMFKFNPVIWAFKYYAMGYDPVSGLFSK